jgi:hypothetical protein
MSFSTCFAYFAWFAVQFPIKNEPIRVEPVFHPWLVPCPGLYLRRDIEPGNDSKAQIHTKIVRNNSRLLAFTRLYSHKKITFFSKLAGRRARSARPASFFAQVADPQQSIPNPPLFFGAEFLTKAVHASSIQNGAVPVRKHLTKAVPFQPT